MSERGRTEFDMRLVEKCSDTCAETAAIDFHAENAFDPANLPSFPNKARALLIELEIILIH